MSRSDDYGGIYYGGMEANVSSIGLLTLLQIAKR